MEPIHPAATARSAVDFRILGAVTRLSECDMLILEKDTYAITPSSPFRTPSAPPTRPERHIPAHYSGPNTLITRMLVRQRQPRVWPVWHPKLEFTRHEKSRAQLRRDKAPERRKPPSPSEHWRYNEKPGQTVRTDSVNPRGADRSKRSVSSGGDRIRTCNPRVMSEPAETPSRTNSDPTWANWVRTRLPGCISRGTHWSRGPV